MEDNATKTAEKEKKSRGAEKKKVPNNLTLTSGCTPLSASTDPQGFPTPVKQAIVPQVEPLTPPNSVLKKRTSSDAGFDDFIDQMPPPPLPPSRSSGGSSDFASFALNTLPGPKFVSCLATTDSSPTSGLAKFSQPVPSLPVSVTPQFVSCLATQDELTENEPTIQIPAPINHLTSNLAALSPNLLVANHAEPPILHSPSFRTLPGTPNSMMNGIEK